MKQVIPTILLLGLPLVSAIADDVIPTRGIGIYPGRAAESAAPHMVVDSVYRNVALNRAAVASSSADYNLTAQLTTDGIRSTGVPATVSVSTRDGRIVGRDKEKSIDGNTVSYNMLMGSDPYIQYDWSGMSVRLDTLRLLAQTAYYEEQATAGCHIRVLASDDGSAWRVVGEYKSDALPGYKGEQTVSSDPNKAEDVVQLPLRKVKMAIPLHSGGNFSHLRLELGMRERHGGASMRLMAAHCVLSRPPMPMTTSSGAPPMPVGFRRRISTARGLPTLLLWPRSHSGSA